MENTSLGTSRPSLRPGLTPRKYSPFVIISPKFNTSFRALSRFFLEYLNDNTSSPPSWTLFSLQVRDHRLQVL